MKREGSPLRLPRDKKSKTEGSKTQTTDHSFLPDLIDIINSFREEKVPNAHEVTTRMAGYFTPKVDYADSGELREGLKHLTFLGDRTWSTLKLPKSLQTLRYSYDGPVDRLRNPRDLQKIDPASYNFFVSQYAKKLGTKKSLEEEFHDSYGWPNP